MRNYLTGSGKSGKFEESLLLGDYCWEGGEERGARRERDQREEINEFSMMEVGRRGGKEKEMGKGKEKGKNKEKDVRLRSPNNFLKEIKTIK